MKTIYLTSEELGYELKIRGISAPRKDLPTRRRILNRLLERENPAEILNYDNPDYNYVDERTEILSGLESLRGLVNEFEGPESDSAFRRIESRLAHVSNRSKRIKIPVEDDNLQEISDFKDDCIATCIELEALLYEKVQQIIEVGLDASVVGQPSSSRVSFGMPHSSQQHASSSLNVSSVTVPIYKWGVQFDGSPQNALPFLERISELAIARKATKDDLFNSAIELFSGDGLVWYRHIRNNVFDWDALVEKLRLTFLPTNHDEKVWDEIKSRKQNKGESTSIFISFMESLFKKLSRKPCDVTKLRLIRQNILPHYITQLALVDVTDLSHLEALCKKLDEAHEAKIKVTGKISRTSQLCSVESSPSVLNKDRPNFSKPVSRNVNNSSNLKCWNCHALGHAFQNCKASRNKFCYKCGKQNVIVRNCPRCGNSNKKAEN